MNASAANSVLDECWQKRMQQLEATLPLFWVCCAFVEGSNVFADPVTRVPAASNTVPFFSFYPTAC